MKLRGGDWSKGDFLALLGVLAAILAIPGMPKILHWDSGTEPSAEKKPVPVTLNAVYIGSLTPVTRTILTVVDPTSKKFLQEVVPDSAGQAKLELRPGSYELRAIGAHEDLAFEVIAPQTTITVQVGDTELASVRAGIASESLSISTGSSRSAFGNTLLVSLISNTVAGDPATRKVSFAVGISGGETHTYRLQDVGAVFQIGGFEIRLSEVTDWGAKFLVEDRRITDQDIADYYAKNRGAFEQYNLERFFVPREGKGEAADKCVELAKSLRARAAAGEDFGKLQKEAFAAAGMKIPAPTVHMLKVRAASLPPGHAAVFDLQEYEVSSVISDSSGYYVYKVNTKEQLPLGRVKDEIRAELQNQRTTSR